MPLSPDHPYYSLNQFLRQRFGEKVVRVPVNLHRICPNRMDARTGCAFCLPEAYEPPEEAGAGSVTEQLTRGMAQRGPVYRARKFIAYFQSGSNTFGPLDELAAAWREALAQPGVAALSISTRPDCLPAELLELLAMLAERHEVWVELGVQTAHDKTLRLLNRGHDATCSWSAIAALAAAGVRHIVPHMILGLPGESEQEMLESFEKCAAVMANSSGGNEAPDDGRWGIKIHHLQVVKGTPLEESWRAGAVSTLALDEYAALLVRVLERTPPRIVIHRLCGSVHERYLCAPRWPGGKAEHIRRIMDEFKRQQTYQGHRSGDSV